MRKFHVTLKPRQNARANVKKYESFIIKQTAYLSNNKRFNWHGIGASCEFYTLGGVTFVTTAKWRQAGQSILRVNVS
jgi:hypothetical protein